MERLVQIALHRGAITPHRLGQAFRGRARRSQQRFHKTTRLDDIEHDALARFDRLHGRLTRVSQHKNAHGLTGERGGFGDDRLVLARHASNEAIAFAGFARFRESGHARNVCLTGTQIKF